jgi:hypothetical protein
MAGIYLIEKDGNLVELIERAYDSEGYLQELLARYPSLLAGDQMDSVEPRRWILIAREMGLPSEEDGSNRWSVDHLFVDQDGIPTIVEVKRSTDTRIRREVIGQMLDYAANGVRYWPVETLRARFEANCVAQNPRQDPTKALTQALGISVSDSEDGIAAFWSRVKINLQAGRIRMVFVADEIPVELARVVEFLNAEMDPAEVLALEVKQFANDTLKTLVPRVIGQTAAAQTRKGGSRTYREWDEASFFLALEQRRGTREVSTCRAIFDWADHRGLKKEWGKGGSDGSFSIRLLSESVTYSLLSAWTYGRVEVQFETLKNKPPFDDEATRLELCRRLNEIPGVSFERDAIERRPSISLATLAQGDAVTKLCEALEWAIQEATHAARMVRE